MPRRRKGKVVRRHHNVSRDWRTGKASRILFLSLVSTFAVCLSLTGSCLLQFGLPILEMRTLRPMRCVLRREQYRRMYVDVFREGFDGSNFYLNEYRKFLASKRYSEFLLRRAGARAFGRRPSEQPINLAFEVVLYEDFFMWKTAQSEDSGHLWCFARPSSVIQAENHDSIIAARNALRNASGYPRPVAETHAPEEFYTLQHAVVDAFWNATSITKTETLELLADMRRIRGFPCLYDEHFDKSAALLHRLDASDDSVWLYLLLIATPACIALLSCILIVAHCCVVGCSPWNASHSKQLPTAQSASAAV